MRPEDDVGLALCLDGGQQPAQLKRIPIPGALQPNQQALAWNGRAIPQRCVIEPPEALLDARTVLTLPPRRAQRLRRNIALQLLIQPAIIQRSCSVLGPFPVNRIERTLGTGELTRIHQEDGVRVWGFETAVVRLRPSPLPFWGHPQPLLLASPPHTRLLWSMGCPGARVVDQHTQHMRARGGISHNGRKTSVKLS